MEITLSIPRNTWSKQIEVRPDVVQAICNAFLRQYADWKPYEPYVNTLLGKFADSGDFFRKEKGCVKFNENEMRTAFKAMQDAGWFFIKHDAMNGTWYQLSSKNYVPSHQHHRRIVTDFNEQWD